MNLNNLTFLITGATGRLGTEICFRLEELGATIIPIVFNNCELKPKRVPWLAKTKPVRVSSYYELDSLKIPDYVINFHWSVKRNLTFTGQLNHELSNSIFINEFFWAWLKDKNLKKFINISSIKVFSHLNKSPVDSLSYPQPVSAYGLTKLLAEQYFNLFFHNSNFRVLNIRLSSVASVGENPSQLMSQLYMSGFQNKRIKININHSTDLLYIKEAIDLIISASLNFEEAKILIGGKGYENGEISERFESVSNKKLNAEYVDLSPRIIDPSFKYENNVITQNFVRKYSLDKMINELINRR
ncbi:MAG TPA: NAD(P)-dependent oxidoreductase [Ignavibacteriaceae bacterium]|nr:NAD(P)-dependent oxidoreductase [Ignavibacteriaceae bacterium]